jgi:hypothetical protein
MGARAQEEAVARLLALVAIFGTLAGCGTWRYEKAGATQIQVFLDAQECRRVSMDNTLTSIPSMSGEEQVTAPDGRLNRGAFNRCMRGRGYTVSLE